MKRRDNTTQYVNGIAIPTKAWAKKKEIEGRKREKHKAKSQNIAFA